MFAPLANIFIPVILFNGIEVPNPEPVGCRPSFTWCDNTPPVNVYLYLISYVLLIDFLFLAINITMNTIYSTIIAPRRQVIFAS